MPPRGTPDAHGPIAPETRILLKLIDESYERKAWHGPNLKGSIRGLSPLEAGWRPRPDRHSIAEIVVHAAYWKYAVRRRLRGEKRGAFALKGSNWFLVPAPLTDSIWRSFVELLDTEHRSLRETVMSFPPDRLEALADQGKVTCLSLIQGIASHDVYHAGQIQLLKRLHPRLA